MQQIEKYLKTESFLLFQDELVREKACRAVEFFLERADKPADKAQLHSISSVIQAGGLRELERLTNKQISKNTKLENKAFWEFIKELLFTDPGDSDYSLRFVLHKQLSDNGFLTDESIAATRPERRSLRRANNAKIEVVMKSILPVYFEHFISHYFYQTH